MNLSRRHAWVITIVATLTMTVSYIDRQALAVLSPTVREALDISKTEYGWLQSAFSIAYLVATPLAGWWIGRVGPRRGLVVSVLVWSAVAALHAVVPGFGVLFLLRIALGVAEGPSYPGSAQTIQAVLPPKDRSRGFGVLFSGSSIGGMIVPPVATAIFALWGWRAAFLVTALVGLIWVPLWIALTSHPAVKERIDATVSKTTTSMFGMLKHQAVQRALISILVAAPPIGFMLAFGSEYLHTTFGVSQKEVGQYLWLPPLLFDAGAIVFGDLCTRIPRRPGTPPRLLYALSMLITMAIVLLPLATDPWMGISIIGISVFGGGGLYTLTVADTYARVPSETVAVAGGLIACAQSIALIILFPIIGAVVDTYGHYDGVAIGIGLWVVPGALVWLAWKPRD
jgi:MFS transporter, ACS family, hexuronate transporter